MADPKRLQIIKGGLNFAKRLLAPEEVAAARARGLGVPGVDFADPIAPASMRMSEALGNAGAEGKTLNFTEADRSRVFGPNRGGVGFSGLQHYSKPHKKANTVWGFGNTNTAEKKIRQNDPENSLWTTFVGSPTQHRSNSVVIGDAMKEFQKSVKQGVVPVEQIMLMNKRLNELTDQKTGAKVFENGFDLTDPSALSVANTFARRAAVGDVMLGLGVKGPMARLDFKNEFPGTKFVDASNIENILKRETDPDLVNANTYDVGNRLFVLDGKIIERPDLNEAFPVQVTGTDLGMKFGLVPPDTAMRDFYKARAGRLDKNQQPSPVGYYDLARVEPSQVVDEDYLTFLQKEGYKEGGAVDMEAADARLAQAIQARMAKGGAVDMEAADARLQAAIQARMGGEKVAHMAGGGGKLKALGDIAKKFLVEPAPPQKIIQAPSIIIPSKISNVKEAVRQSKGEYGAKRVERAADEIPNLERLYKEEALKQAFEGDNAKPLMTMNPKDFENYAMGLPTRTVTEPRSFGDKTRMSTEDYLKYLRTLPEGFDDVPFLEINKQEQGLPLMPFISAHEGRHRNRAMAEGGEKAGLVRLFPRQELREGFPRRSQEEYIEALKKELEMTGNLVLPEHNRYNPTDVQRPAIELPDIYAKGGGVHMADAGFVFKGVKNIGKRFMADPAESSVASARRGERTADQIGGLNIVKETGGNFLTGRTAKDLSPLKRNVTTRAIENGRYTPEQVAQIAEKKRRVQANDALNNWVDSNLTNYVEKQMGTANDPVRLMFDKRAQEIDAKYAKDIAKSDRIAQKATKELDPRKQANLMREAERIKAEANIERQIAVNHISHNPSLLQEYSRTAENVKKQRMEAGFSEEGVGQSPIAKAWERASDEAIATHRAGDIQGMPEKYAKLTEAENKLRAAQEAVESKFKQQMENVGIEGTNNMHFATSLAQKAKIIGDTDLAKASAEYQSLQSPMMDNYMELGRQNPYINKLDPETPLYAPFTGDLGFDHIMDVLREDLTTGRIRPEQLSKVNMEQAVRRTSEYDQELAAKMNASRAAAREGLPTYREYPEGYKWIELNKPGAFAQESEAMGHSVRGYEPPKGHPDWTEASGDAGSFSYGHGGWEAIKSGKAKVYSLVDSKGAPHATVETKIGGGHEYAGEKNKEIIRLAEERGIQKYMAPGNESLWAEAEKNLAERGVTPPQNITQIKGKQNAAPNEEYLPYVQDFVKGGQWSDVGDLRNTGLRNTSDVFGPIEMQKFKESGIELPSHLNADEQKAMQDKWYTLETGKNPDTGMARGGALRKLQFMDDGGIASPEENITSDQKPNRFSRVASEMYDEAKQSLAKDYERLKSSAIARAQLAKIAAAQLAGGSLDFASMVTPLVNSDALLSAFPMARAAKIGLTGSPFTGRRTSVLSDEKTPYSLADYTNDINGNPRGGSEDIIKRAQKAGLMYGGTRMMYDAQEPDPSKEMLTMTPKEYEKLLNSEGRNRIDFGEQITTGRFSPVTEIGTAILGGNLGSKLARGAVNTGQKFKKGFDKGHARAMSRQAPPFLRELEYAPSKKRGGLTQLKAR